MRLIHLLLILSVVLLLLIGVVSTLPQAGEAPASANPEFSSLLVSNESFAGQPGVLGFGYLIGILMIAAMAVSVLIGITKHGKLGTLGRWLLGGFVAYALVFTAVIYSYQRYDHGNAQNFFGGFPLSTAWLVYGVWLFPWFFIAVLVIMFDRSFLTQSDLDRFHALVQKSRDKS